MAAWTRRSLAPSIPSLTEEMDRFGVVLMKEKLPVGGLGTRWGCADGEIVRLFGVVGFGTKFMPVRSVVRGSGELGGSADGLEGGSVEVEDKR